MHNDHERRVATVQQTHTDSYSRGAPSTSIIICRWDDAKTWTRTESGGWNLCVASEIKNLKVLIFLKMCSKMGGKYGG